MTDPNFILLYVNSPAESATFYAGLLGHEPIESSPTFAMFALSSGIKLGLWSRHTVEPSPSGTPGAHEMAFAVPDSQAVNALHDKWLARGLPVIQAPQQMDFGFTFVAHDPDGHRLRVFAPS